MAIAIAEVAATGADLLDEAAQDAIVQRWLDWSRGAKDVGIQTGSVLQGRDAGRRHHRGAAPARSLRRFTGRPAARRATAR